MALPPDRVQVIKQESAALGGDAADEVPYDSPIEAQEDAIESAGIYLQNAGNRDESTLIWRDTADDMKFKDGSNPSGATLTDLLSGTDDKKTKVSAGDTTPNFLEQKLVAGTNVTITKQGTGADETLEVAASSASVPTPTCCGQVLYALDTGVFTPELPLTSCGGWLVNNSGHLLVVG